MDEDAILNDAQSIEMKFRAPQEGSYEFQVICMSDCWIGCDQTISLKFSVRKQPKAIQPVVATVPRKQEPGLFFVTSINHCFDCDKNLRACVILDDEDENGTDDPVKESDDLGENSSNEDEDDSEDEYEYDSDESGELETGSDEDEAETS